MIAASSIQKPRDTLKLDILIHSKESFIILEPKNLKNKNILKHRFREIKIIGIP
tara:strand:+ start:220 stop:381 length:162 start_codon:yes stop_codon:yes gene_type:complete